MVCLRPYLIFIPISVGPLTDHMTYVTKSDTDKSTDEKINIKSSDLYVAAVEGNIKELEGSLNAGVDVNRPPGIYKDVNTALMWAAQNGQMSDMKLYLEKGAHVNSIDSNGITALMRATWNGETECAALLLELGADVNKINNKKVLLRERKRHTARRVVSTPSVVLPGYPPPRGGYLTRVPPRGGVRVPPRRCLMAFWEMLQSIMGYGYPPPVDRQMDGWKDRRLSKHYLPSYSVRGR